MVWLKHKGCSTPIVEYIGVTPLVNNPPLFSKNWVFAENIEHGDHIRSFICPDCGKKDYLHAWAMESCDGSPTRYFEHEDYGKPEPTLRQRFIKWIKGD